MNVLFHRYAKFVVALCGTLAGLITSFVSDPSVGEALSDNNVTGSEWRLLLIALVTAVAVRQVPNTPPTGELSRPDMSEQG